MQVRKKPSDLVHGEHFLKVHPEPSLYIEDFWRRRANHFTGRSVNHIALESEMGARSRRLAVHGRLHTRGVVRGLEVGLATDTSGLPELYIAAGFGITASGEDVRIDSPVRLPIIDLPLWTRDANGHPTLSTVGDALDTNQDQALFILLEPTVHEHIESFDPTDPCERDPSDYPYERWEYLDAVRIVAVAWQDASAMGTALPAASPRWRNELAYAAFDYEQENFGPAPWEALGLPIALLGAPKGGDLFVDAASVARRGGPVSTWAPYVRRTGTPALWQARVEQFSEELSQLDVDSLVLTGLYDRFRWLPPVGMLPKGALDVRGDGESDGYLPDDLLIPRHFELTALPVELETLDDVLEQSASLLPFDTQLHEQIQILAPVPTAYFEPGLLIVEQVDPKFARTIEHFRYILEQDLTRRAGIWSSLRLFAKRLVNRDLPATMADPGAIEGEGDPTSPHPDDVGDPPEPERDFEGEVADYYEALADRLAKIVEAESLRRSIGILGGQLVPSNTLVEAMTDHDFADLGHRRCTKKLKETLDRADEKLDVTFARVQAELYRVRQIVAGASDATTLATSPAAGKIFETSKAAPSTDQVATFAGQLVKSAALGDTSISVDKKIGSGYYEGPVAKSVTELDPNSFAPMILTQALGATGTAALAGATAGVAAGTDGLGTTTTPLSADGALAGMMSISLGSIPSGGAVGVAAEVEDFELEQGTVAKVYRALDLQEHSAGVYRKRAPVSMVYDTSIAARLAVPPSTEVHSFAREARLRAYDTIEEISQLGIWVDDLQLPGFVPQVNLHASEIVHGLIPFKTLRPLLANRAAWVQDSVSGQDEAAFFSTGIKSIEATVAALRLVEERLEQYREVVRVLEEAFADLRVLWAEARGRLAELAIVIAEDRHDVTVARALLDEEIERVARVNERRQRIVEEHVPFLVFRRARTTDLRRAIPVRTVDPARIPDPVPACLQGDHDAPEQLRMMVSVLGEAPIAWFPQLRANLRRVDHLPSIHRVLKRAYARSAESLPELAPAFQHPSFTKSLLGRRIGAVFNAQFGVIARTRNVMIAHPIEYWLASSWERAMKHAEETVSLNDCREGWHGRQDLSVASAGTVEMMGRAAACLFTKWRDVPPVIRLEWTDKISQFDDPIDLRRLSALPSWHAIDRLDRHDLQSIVDYLYRRVDPSNNDAVAFVHDLVRMTILLASHAPVSEILEGTAVEPDRPVAVGNNVLVRVDPERVRMGMSVLLYSESRALVGHGKVVDVEGDHGNIRILRIDEGVTKVHSVQISQWWAKAYGTVAVSVSSGL